MLGGGSKAMLGRRRRLNNLRNLVRLFAQCRGSKRFGFALDFSGADRVCGAAALGSPNFGVSLLDRIFIPSSDTAIRHGGSRGTCLERCSLLVLLLLLL